MAPILSTYCIRVWQCNRLHALAKYRIGKILMGFRIILSWVHTLNTSLFLADSRWWLGDWFGNCFSGFSTSKVISIKYMHMAYFKELPELAFGNLSRKKYLNRINWMQTKCSYCLSVCLSVRRVVQLHNFNIIIVEFGVDCGGSTTILLQNNHHWVWGATLILSCR